MEHGPLPPHERTWRHPSELAAEEHALARAETAPTTTRMFAVSTGVLGLLAVGLLILAVTPTASEAPVAISATTTPVEITAVAVAPTVRTPIGLRGRPDALATPIGEGRFAVLTVADLPTDTAAAGIGSSVEVAVPSGRLHVAVIVGLAGDTVLVELESVEPGVPLANRRPSGDDVVTVLSEPPITVQLDDLAGLEVEEGTAVLDGDGDLVGLCSESRDETRLVEVSHQLAAEATDHMVEDPVEVGGDVTGDASDDTTGNAIDDATGRAVDDVIDDD